jgi:hypothetical protein
MEAIWVWLENNFVQGFVVAVLGLALGWLLARWRRHRLRLRAEHGDAREMVAIEQILVRDQPDGRTTMRIRSSGSAPLRHVLGNQVALEAFLERAEATTPTEPLISMKDPMGSYLLYLVCPWVCGMTRGGAFAHDVWVLAPVCEPGLLSAHQATTIVLVREKDLRRFLDWDFCQRLHVEHGSDGARILTLWHMAHEFVKQLAEVKLLHETGQPTTFAETMYILDLGLDMTEVDLPTKPVPWKRFAPILKELNLNGGEVSRAA